MRTIHSPERSLPPAFPPPALRIRSDIAWICYSENRRWVAQDPIANAFYYFSEVEYEAACLLDGSKSLIEIVQIVNRRALRSPISLTWLEVLVQRLLRTDLLQPLPQNPACAARRGSKKFRFLNQIATNPLAIRIPLLRPSRQFRFAENLAAFLFHRGVMYVGIVLLAVTSFLLLARWLHRPEQIFYDITRLQGERWLALLGMLLVIKSLHELGHYLATVRWKADCHELGILLLCFSPCLYCDTTQAWKLRSRWQRAAISAAGIYVELWIAAIGGLVFLNTESGLWHTLGAGAWLTCTLGTLVINGNPCFRYDGYYILSDLWGVPNLGAQSSSALWRTAVHWLGGRSPDPSRYDKPVWQLALFALVSGIYRTLVLALILAMVWTFLVPAGLGMLALLILASIGLGISFMLWRNLQAALLEFMSSTPIAPWRFAILLLAIGGAAWTAAKYPIPLNVRARGFAELRYGKPVYVTATSVLRDVRTTLGGEVEKGQPLFDADAPEKRLEWLQLSHELEELRVRIRILEESKVSDESANYELPTLLELKSELEAKQKLLWPELASLRQEVAARGFYVPQESRVPKPFADGTTRWEPGHLLAEERLGMVLERGMMTGWLSSEYAYDMHALVPESDVRWIQVGMRAEAILDSQASLRIPCQVTRVAPEPVPEFPRELLGDSSLVALRDIDGRLRVETPHYLVVLEPVTQPPSVWRGSLVSVHFELPGKTLVQMLSEIVQRQFRTQRR